MVDEADIGSWDLLWNKKYSGKILMFDLQSQRYPSYSRQLFLVTA
jgi:hypothetical protein